MPTNRKRVRRSRRTWTTTHFHHLQTGYDFLHDAFSKDAGLEPHQGGGEVLPGMRECWKQHGDQITADRIARHPGTRPWYWWIHKGLITEGTDIDEQLGMTQADWLAAHHELGPDELRRVNEPSHLLHLANIRRELAWLAGDPESQVEFCEEWDKYAYPVTENETEEQS